MRLVCFTNGEFQGSATTKAVATSTTQPLIGLNLINTVIS